MLLFLLCNVVTVLSMDLPVVQLHDFKKMVRQSMDTPALPFNPIDGVMIVDVIKENNLILLEDMLAAFGPQSCGKGLDTAAAYGRVDCMKFFLKYGADPNQTTANGNTPLHYAKTVKAADYLLENDAFIDAKNKKGKTPLYTALFCRHERSRVYPYKSQGLYIAQLLIDNDADINAVDKDGNTLLHSAIEKRNLAAAEFLLSNNINSDKTNKAGATAFELVVDRYLDEFYPLFEKYGKMFFPRMKIVHLSDQAFCKVLTKETLFHDRNTVISIDRIGRLFVWAKQYDMLRSSPKKGLFFDRHGCIANNVSQEHLQQLLTPEMFKKCENILRFLRKEMDLAVSNNDVDFLEELLHQFPWLVHDNGGLTHWMIRKTIKKEMNDFLPIELRINEDKKYNACLDSLLGTKIDKPLSFLYLAIKHDNPEAIRLLIKHGLDYFQDDNEAQTPLQYALELRREKCAETLNALLCKLCISCYKDREYRKSKQYLSSIINVNAPIDKENNTLLHDIISEKNHKKSLQFIPLLIAKGADVNRRNSKGYVPLNFVKMNNNGALAVFKMLLNEGADVNNIGRGLLGLGLLTKKDEYIRLLLKHGVIVNKEHLGITESVEIAALLKQQYEKQQCCVCLDNPGDLACIKCSCKHSEFLCRECNNQLNTCPLCRGILLK